MFPNGSHVGVVNISGTFTPKVTLNGTYNGVGDSGTFFLNYSSLYERPSSLEVIAGKWSGSVSGYLNTITIDSSGNITGSSTSGCTYSGNISIIDSSYNAYIVNLNINNCESQNGLYTGLAALADTSVANDTLLASVSNSSYSYVALLIRQ